MLDEYIKTPHSKPPITSIERLREQKRQVVRSKQGDCDLRVGMEYELCNLLSKRIPRHHKEQRIKDIIEKIKELQKKNNISEFSRNFLNTLLNIYTEMDYHKKNVMLQEILKYARVREGVKTKKYLIEDKPTGLKARGTQERKFREIGFIETYYSFL